DAVGAPQVRLDRRPDGIGLVGAARLAHGRDMVDVHAQLDHRSPSPPSMRCRSRTRLRVASSCPLSEWWMRSRMSCLDWAAVVADAKSPRSRSISVWPANLTAFDGAPSCIAGTGPRSTTYRYSRSAAIGAWVPASRASSTA